MATMLPYVWVQLKRLLIFALGIILAWFTAFGFFPAVDKRLPFLVALLVTYCFLAYVGIPALLRIRHLTHPPRHVPTRAITRDGWALDPINLAVLAKNEKEFIWAMEKAGWRVADPPTLFNTIHFCWAFVLNRPYPTAPFSSLYVFGRKQDIGFQIPLADSPRHRHHVRFWRVGSTVLEDEHEHQNFWRKLLKKFLRKEKQVWVGAAILDHGINVRRRNLQITHRVHGNTVLERDYVVESLQKANVLKDTATIKAGEPLRSRHQSFGETIISDGNVKLCELKRQFLPPIHPLED
ncbi:MAG: LssY C-terminal domain-containing protein [Candidatus Saccharimonadales bacterium]